MRGCPVTNESAAARQRRMARRRILREIGVAPKDATRGSECVSRFVSMIEGQGGDPEELDPGGELRKIREGGRPKVNIPDNEARSARYRELRKMGLGSLAATEGARTEGTFAMAVRRLVALVVLALLAACSGAPEAPDVLLSPEPVSSAGHDPLAPLTIVDTEEPEECGLAFDVPDVLLPEAEAAAARWSAATGCDVRVEAGGVPIVQQPYVLIQDEPDGSKTVHAEQSTDGTRRHVCGATLFEAGALVAIYLATENHPCNVKGQGTRILPHEMGHALGGYGHTDGGMMHHDSPVPRPRINGADLALVCSRLRCARVRPEA